MLTSLLLLCQEFQGHTIQDSCSLGLCHCRSLKANFWNKPRFPEWLHHVGSQGFGSAKWEQTLVTRHFLSLPQWRRTQLRRSVTYKHNLRFPKHTETILPGKFSFQTRSSRPAVTPKGIHVSEKRALCTSPVFPAAESGERRSPRKGVLSPEWSMFWAGHVCRWWQADPCRVLPGP